LGIAWAIAVWCEVPVVGFVVFLFFNTIKNLAKMFFSQAGSMDEMDFIVSLKSYEGNNNQMLMAADTGDCYDSHMRK